jgi:type IV pilus assembly protein PilF
MPRNCRRSLIAAITGLLAMSFTACSWFSSSSSPSSEKPSDIYLQLGVRYMDLNKLELAKENLEKALEKDRTNARAHSALAYLYERINHFDDARRQYENALSILPDDISIENNYGRFLCDRREFDKGLGYLKAATSNMLNDRVWIALTNSARCYLGMGQRDQAAQNLQQALNQNGNYAPALMEMQKISYQSGEYRAAQDYLQRYLGQEGHTPGTLWIAIQTEQALGNNSLANEYRTLLLDKFPTSNEARQISGIRQ